MDLGIKNRAALVTGASTGLGFAAAKALADEGVRLAINSRSEEKLKKAAEAINKACGSKPLILPGDLAQSNIPEKLIADMTNKFGSVDIIVSNAGGPPAGMFFDHDKTIWQKAAELTLFSAINLVRAAIPSMKKNGWGRIIFITSISVKQPIGNLIMSNTYRSGLTGFAKSISNEFASSGITVNTVCPGYTKTERLQSLAEYEAGESGQSTDEIYQAWAANVPAGRLGEPEELASLITFLASAKAAYINGTAIPVDGGYIKSLL